MKIIRAKTHRLPRDRYCGLVSTSFTACLQARKSLFTRADTVEPFVQTLAQVLKDHSCTAVYCFMPDHLHLIISGTSLTSDTLLAMEEFKQRTGWWLRTNASGVW